MCLQRGSELGYYCDMGGGIFTLWLLTRIYKILTASSKPVPSVVTPAAGAQPIPQSEAKSIAGSTPASPPDPNGNGEKHSYQKIGKNSFANKIAQKFGYENAEEFKDSIVGQGNGGRFNIGYDKVSKEVVLIRIQGNDVIPTGYFLEFPIY